MAFETGHPMDFMHKLYIILEHYIKFHKSYQSLKLKQIQFEHKKYNKISFDGINRGPLCLLLIGLSFSCLIFAIELIIFLKFR